MKIRKEKKQRRGRKPVFLEIPNSLQISHQLSYFVLCPVESFIYKFLPNNPSRPPRKKKK